MHLPLARQPPDLCISPPPTKLAAIYRTYTLVIMTGV